MSLILALSGFLLGVGFSAEAARLFILWKSGHRFVLPVRAANWRKS